MPLSLRNKYHKLGLSFVLNTAFTIVELIVGVSSGSLALISDGMRNFSDSVTLSVALLAERLSKKRSDHRRTFGYSRVKIIASLINTGILFVIAIFICYQAVVRFNQPRALSGVTIVIVALGGAIVNGLAALILHNERKDLNIGSTYTGLLYGAFGSIGIAIAGLLIVMFGWYWADDVAGIAVALMLLWATLSLARDAIHVLLEGVPAEVDMDEVRAALMALDGVESIRHVRAWTIGHFNYAFNCQLVVTTDNFADSQVLVGIAKELLRARFGFNYTSLEVTPAG